MWLCPRLFIFCLLEASNETGFWKSVTEYFISYYTCLIREDISTFTIPSLMFCQDKLLWQDLKTSNIAT